MPKCLSDRETRTVLFLEPTAHVSQGFPDPRGPVVPWPSQRGTEDWNTKNILREYDLGRFHAKGIRKGSLLRRSFAEARNSPRDGARRIVPSFASLGVSMYYLFVRGKGAVKYKAAYSSTGPCGFHEHTPCGQPRILLPAG